MAFREPEQSSVALRVRLLRCYDTLDAVRIRYLDLVVQVRHTSFRVSVGSTDLLLNRHSQKDYKRSHEEGLSKFEQELKMRVRSATGTW